MSKNIIFSQHALDTFAKHETDLEQVRTLMFDLYKGELVDMTKREAEDKLREFTRDFFGLTKNSSKRDRKNAYKKYADEYFAVIEEVSDFVVTTGFRENEWFNVLTNYKNLAEGDENLFTNDAMETILAIGTMGKRHHDTILQRLPQGKSYSVETDLYSAAVGADIDRYIVGQEDFTKLINAIAKAFIEKVQTLILGLIETAYTKLPVQTGFVESGALTVANRKRFNKVGERVSTANDNAKVIIMGTTSALQELDNLIPVNWIAASQKEQVAQTGRLGSYGPYQLVEIPQRFARNDVTRELYRDDRLYFFAQGDDKLVDFVDVGEVLIDEITERGEANGRIDDIMKYEAQREFGASIRLGRYFGQWTITED